MKKVAAFLFALVLLVCTTIGTFSVSAETQYTKDQLIAKVSESAIYKYVKGDVENLARTTTLTDAQINELYAVAEKFVALNLTDKGGSAHKYTSAEISSVLALVQEACDILNYTYEFAKSSDALHVGDTVFTVYDASGKMVYTFDGDVVKKTGSNQTVLFVTIGLLGCALLAAAVFATKKRLSVQA